VKAAVAAGTLGAAAASGALTLIPLSRPGEAPPSFKYWGVRVLPGSKAPRGLPIIPVRVDGGLLKGEPTHLEWYRYCGRNNAPGLRPGFPTDNVFRYHVDRGVLAGTLAEGIDAWYATRLRSAARLDDFAEVGMGAPVLWRSDGFELSNPLTVLLIRVDPKQYPSTIAERFFPDGVLAVFNTCAHMCLVPTWRASRKGYGEGHWDDITCFGHGSWFSPREIVEYSFPPTG
jgi:Rieske Fe-S protein